MKFTTKRFRFDDIHEQAILTVGFLGGIAFAALVFLLGNKTIPRSELEFPFELLSVCSGLSAITVFTAFAVQIFDIRAEKGRIVMFMVTYFFTGMVFATFFEGLISVVLIFDEGFGTLLHISLLGVFAIIAVLLIWAVKLKE